MFWEFWNLKQLLVIICKYIFYSNTLNNTYQIFNTNKCLEYIEIVKSDNFQCNNKTFFSLIPQIILILFANKLLLSYGRKYHHGKKWRPLNGYALPS